MMALWIVLGVLACAILLLHIPVCVHLTFQEEPRIFINYLFLRFAVYPREKPVKEEGAKTRKKAKRRGGAADSATPEDEPDTLRELLEKHGLLGLLELLTRAATAAGGAFRELCPHIVIQDLDLNIRVATEDAAETAILYGYTTGAVSTALGALLHLAAYRRYHIQIVPDFDAKKSEIGFRTEVRLRPLYVLTTSFGLLRRLLAIWREL